MMLAGSEYEDEDAAEASEDEAMQSIVRQLTDKYVETHRRKKRTRMARITAGGCLWVCTLM